MFEMTEEKEITEGDLKQRCLKIWIQLERIFFF